MKVLLVSITTEGGIAPVQPLGLACIAAAARGAGHETALAEIRPEQIDPFLGARIGAFGPDAIGVSVRNIDDQTMENPRFLLAQVRDLVRECRRWTRAPIIVGGAGFSIFPESALAYLEADLGIQGEGEAVFPALLERLERRADLDGLPGLYLPGKGLQAERSFIRDFDAVPFPDYGCLSLSPHDRDLWVQVQAGRGCPLGCSYCSTAVVEGRVKRTRAPRTVVRAVRRLTEAGFRRFYLVDNTFNLPLPWAKEICRELIAADLDIRWMCILYPRFIDAEFVRLLAQAGCRHVGFGFESGSPEVLRAMNKRYTPEDVRRASRMLADAGIRQMGFLLLGGPGETRDTAEESIVFAESLPLETLKATVGIRIYPDTPLARLAAAEGVIAPQDDLLHPRFYIARGLGEWLQERIERWAAARPQFVI